MPCRRADSNPRMQNRHDLTSTLIFPSEVLRSGVNDWECMSEGKGITSRPLATDVWRTLSQIFAVMGGIRLNWNRWCARGYERLVVTGKGLRMGNVRGSCRVGVEIGRLLCLISSYLCCFGGAGL